MFKYNKTKPTSMRILLFLTVFELVLRAVESKNLGNLDLVCKCDDESVIRSLRNKLFDCETICKNDSDESECFENNCEKRLPTFKRNVHASYCRDEFDGKFYEIGKSWSRNCTVYFCEENMKIAKRDARCPQGCLLESNEANKCCPVCRSKLTCSPKELIIEIPLPLLRNAEPRRLALSDPNCKPFVNSTHVILRTKLSACGTKLTKTAFGFKYSNFVQKNAVLSKIIIRPWLKFSCSFRNTISHANNYQQIPSFRVGISALVLSKRISMHYTNAIGDILPNQKKMTFLKGTPVYVLVSGTAISAKSHFLVLESCLLASKRISERRPLIFEGCPVNPNVKIHLKTPSYLWFSFKANYLKKFSNYIDLQCQAAICSKKANAEICSRTCQDD